MPETSAGSLVCVVDDHESVREALLGLLTSLGLRVVTFEDAEAARDSLADADCLILDLHLPGMSGLDLLRELRARALALPVIVITGRLDSRADAAIREAGVEALLVKPFDEAELMAALAKALGRGTP